MFKEKRTAALVSVAASLIVALAILSFRQYFFYVPFAKGFNTLSFLGFLTMIGWVSLVVVPPVLLSSPGEWTSAKSRWLIVAAVLYPIATTSVKLCTLALYGQIWANYLVLYPILFFMEWILPAAYVLFAIRFGVKGKKLKPEAGNYLAQD
jgi:hypothetical protein